MFVFWCMDLGSGSTTTFTTYCCRGRWRLIVNGFGWDWGMAIGEERRESQSESEGKVWNLLKLPFRHSTVSTSNSVSSLARSLLPTRRRLKLDPSSKLYFPCMRLFPLSYLFTGFVFIKFLYPVFNCYIRW